MNHCVADLWNNHDFFLFLGWFFIYLLFFTDLPWFSMVFHRQTTRESGLYRRTVYECLNIFIYKGSRAFLLPQNGEKKNKHNISYCEKPILSSFRNVKVPGRYMSEIRATSILSCGEFGARVSCNFYACAFILLWKYIERMSPKNTIFETKNHSRCTDRAPETTKIRLEVSAVGFLRSFRTATKTTLPYIRPSVEKSAHVNKFKKRKQIRREMNKN